MHQHEEKEDEEPPSVQSIAEDAMNAYGNDDVNKMVKTAMEKINGDDLSFEDREEARKLAASEIEAGLKKSDKEPAQNLVQAGWGMDFALNYRIWPNWGYPLFKNVFR